MRHRDEFTVAVKAWMGSHSLQDVDKLFQQHDAPGMPIKNIEDLMNDPHIRAREMIISVPDKELGAVQMQGVVPKLSITPGKVKHAGQMLGESNNHVYKDLLGCTEDRLRDLRQKGVI